MKTGRYQVRNEDGKAILQEEREAPWQAEGFIWVDVEFDKLETTQFRAFKGGE